MTTKMKNIRDYIIGLLVICALIVALILTKEKKDNIDYDSDTTVELFEVVSLEGEPLTDMTISDVNKVSYTLGDNEPVVIERSEDTWIVNGDKNFPTSVDAFEQQFLQKYIDGEVFDEITDYESLSDYGFDNPSATIEVIDKDNNARTYLLGAYNHVLGIYYLYHKEEDKLYTGSSDFYIICRDDVYDFAGIDSFPSFSTTSLESLVMNNGEKKVEFKYLADGHDADPFGTSTWFVASPFTVYRACESDEVTDNFDKVFTGVGFTKKADYYATDEELKQYGLLDSDRYYEIIYRFEDEESASGYNRVAVKVLFGNYVEKEDSYYARVILTQGLEVDEERARSINYISRDSVDTILNIDPVDYIYPFLLYVPMKDYDDGGISVTKADGTKMDIKYDAVYGSDGSVIPEKETVWVNDTIVDLEEYKEFYYQFTKIYVNRGIYSKSEIVDCEPTYVVEYDRIEDDYFGDAVVEYRLYDSTYYQVSINGITDSLVVRRDVDKAMTMLEELIK